MTVKELIELLKQQNQDADVYYDEGGAYLMISEVATDTTEDKQMVYLS